MVLFVETACQEDGVMEIAIGTTLHGIVPVKALLNTIIVFVEGMSIIGSVLRISKQRQMQLLPLLLWLLLLVLLAHRPSNSKEHAKLPLVRWPEIRWKLLALRPIIVPNRLVNHRTVQTTTIRHCIIPVPTTLVIWTP